MTVFLTLVVLIVSFTFFLILNGAIIFTESTYAEVLGSPFRELSLVLLWIPCGLLLLAVGFVSEVKRTMRLH